MSDVDPYIDPETGILRNLVGARTQAELDRAEAAYGSLAGLELLRHPVPATNNVAELRAIHRRLLGDVYDWAGEIRVVNLRKNAHDAKSFHPVSRLGMASQYVDQALREDNFLRGMSRDQLVERLTDHYDLVNTLHPFREGNGRAQRFFWSRVTRDAGWELDWSSVTGEENDHASRAAREDNHMNDLHQMFDRITTAAAGHPTEPDIDDLSRRGLRVGTRWQRHRDQHPAEPGYRPGPATPPGRSRGDEERGIE